MIIVTGGAGFIGSALVWALNERGERTVIIVDELDHDEKERNIAPLTYEELLSIPAFREKLQAGDFNDKNVRAIFHLGACSDTTEQNWEYLEDNNIAYTQDIIRWAADHGVRCIYASSGAVYGDGSHGYSDEHDLFDQLTPRNLYGKSKLAVDVWARDGGYLENVVGLRYFNVFGPNEAHKGHMRSVVAKHYEELTEKGTVSLFKSYQKEFGDGEQRRDFVYVKDAVAATLFFLDTPGVNGVFNVGTGEARSWNEVARAMFAAAGQPEKIQYIDMPEEIRAHYQYFTQADISKLRAVGFKKPFTPLTEAVADYIKNYLEPDKHLGEE